MPIMESQLSIWSNHDIFALSAAQVQEFKLPGQDILDSPLLSATLPKLRSSCV
jgi:hypothetical protein